MRGQTSNTSRRYPGGGRAATRQCGIPRTPNQQHHCRASLVSAVLLWCVPCERVVCRAPVWFGVL
eukprot:429454-Pyramimonas_sp.AAC.1